jgi:hypothetical protein
VTRDLTPDVAGFLDAVHASVAGKRYDNHQAAADFRRLFLLDPELGRRVLHTLLTWAGEYTFEIPQESEALQRWAGKREIATRIKAAMYADLTTPEPERKDT